MVAMLGRREQLALLLLNIFAFQHSEGLFKKLITIENDGNNYESNEHVNLKFPTVKLLKPFNFFDKKEEKLANKGDALGALIENNFEKWEARKEKFDEKLLDLIDTLKEKEQTKLEIKDPAYVTSLPAPVPTPTPAPAPVIRPPSVYGPAPYPAYHASAPERYHAPPPHYPPAPYHAPDPYHVPASYHPSPSAYRPQPAPSPSYNAPAPSYGYAPATSYKAPASTFLFEAAVEPTYRAPAPAQGSPSAYAYHSPKHGHSSHYYSHYKPATPAPYRYYVEHDCSEEQTYSYKPVRPIRPKPKPKPDTHYHDCDDEVRYFT